MNFKIYPNSKDSFHGVSQTETLRKPHNELQFQLFNYLDKHRPHYLYITCSECDCIRPIYLGRYYSVKREHVHQPRLKRSRTVNGRKIRYGHARSDISLHHVDWKSLCKKKPITYPHTVIEIVYTHEVTKETLRLYKEMGVNVIMWNVNHHTCFKECNYVLNDTNFILGRSDIIPKAGGWRESTSWQDTKENPI